MIIVLGEITTTAMLDYPRIVRDTVKQIGYDDSDKGVNILSCHVLCIISCMYTCILSHHKYKQITYLDFFYLFLERETFTIRKVNLLLGVRGILPEFILQF